MNNNHINSDEQSEEDEDILPERFYWPDDKPKKNNKERYISIVNHIDSLRSDIENMNEDNREYARTLYEQNSIDLIDLSGRTSDLLENTNSLTSAIAKGLVFKVIVVLLLLYIAIQVS